MDPRLQLRMYYGWLQAQDVFSQVKQLELACYLFGVSLSAPPNAFTSIGSGAGGEAVSVVSI